MDKKLLLLIGGIILIVIIIQNFKLGTEAVVISDLCQIPSSLILLPGGVLVNSVDTNIAKQGESIIYYPNIATYDIKSTEPPISFTDNQGGIGYYYDICVDSNQLTQYGCSDSQGGAELTYTTSSTNCLSGYKCYNGACIQQSCNTDADADCNGAISLTEIHSYGQKWLNSQITRTKVGQAIQAWSGG